MLVYADTSALVKLMVTEPETRALTQFASDVDILLTSRIAQVEMGRAALRTTLETNEVVAGILGQLEFRELTIDICTAAARLDPPALRALDAVHLATALELSSELDAFLTYDTRLAAAAKAHGLLVAAPA